MHDLAPREFDAVCMGEVLACLIGICMHSHQVCRAERHAALQSTEHHNRVIGFATPVRSLSAQRPRFSKSLRSASKPQFLTSSTADLLLQKRHAQGLPLRLITRHLPAVRCLHIHNPWRPRLYGEVPYPITNTTRSSTPVSITRIIAHSPCPTVVTHNTPTCLPQDTTAKPHRSSAFTTICTSALPSNPALPHI